MLEISRIYLSSGLLLAIFTLIFHIIAMEYPRWKIYEHRRNPNETMFIGLFHRCENRFLNGILNTSKIYLVCDNNKYLPSNKNLSTLIHKVQPAEAQRLCNIADHRNSTNDFEQNIRQIAASDYDIRLDWSAGLEIISLILSSFTLVSQILYLFSTYRNRIG
ncbi:unnamed protein product [Rotaria socialis]|uniref:Uncharacterized protein n=1 Tax=Rotaria socialis TaxID=392032 RepID=A0A820GGK5_9BILA|nr:unnamed protein product [Rotaria socialis]